MLSILTVGLMLILDGKQLLAVELVGGGWVKVFSVGGASRRIGAASTRRLLPERWPLCTRGGHVFAGELLLGMCSANRGSHALWRQAAMDARPSQCGGL